MTTRTRVWLLLLAGVLLLGLGSFFIFQYLKPVSEPAAARDAKKDFIFAKYDFRPSPCSPKLPQYHLNLPELTNLHAFEKAARQPFSIPQRQALQEKHFFIAMNLDKFYAEDPDELDRRHDDWTYLYSRIGGPEAPQERRPENAVFITTDFLLHVYHRLLEKEFEFTEQRVFYPKLKKLSDTLLDYCLQEYNRAPGEEQKDSFKRLVAYFAVPAAILNSAANYYDQEKIADDQADAPSAIFANLEKLKGKMPAEAYALARQELALVLAAQQVAPSPLLGKYQQEQGLTLPEDYTQFGPRSHYNKNPILRTYFRAMMWYGRVNFLLSSPQLTRDAVNITLLLNQAKVLQDWEDIYLATTFFVGESDDLGFYEYRQAMKELTPEAKAAEIDKNFLTGLQKTLQNYRNPRILSAAAIGEQVFALSKEELQVKTKGFRFMGQRFTPDAFIFSYLTQGQEQPDPKTGERLPSQPTALMVMVLLGSKSAEPLLAAWIDQRAPGSRTVLKNRMAELDKYFNKLPLADWSQNIYWGWLYTLKALFTEGKDKTGYPMFMKSSDWERKNLQSALGSWTELKHDTLLYAKQAYAELGDGEAEKKIPPVPKGYVEPNLDFFDRFIPLVKMTKEGLEQRGLLDNLFIDRHSQFLETVEFFKQMVVSQLQNEKISVGDFERLRLAAGNLGWVLSPLPGEEGTENYARAALIADVHTDLTKQEILYEAVGIPNYIYVAVKDQNGARLTKGLVYAHYEFSGPLGERLTDEKWRQWNYTADKNKLPPMADWAKSLIK